MVFIVIVFLITYFRLLYLLGFKWTEKKKTEMDFEAQTHPGCDPRVVSSATSTWVKVALFFGFTNHDLL